MKKSMVLIVCSAIALLLLSIPNNAGAYSEQDLNTFNNSMKCQNCDLSMVNLSGRNLAYANLTNANLTMANLSGADLNRANLTNANLTMANLSTALLNNTNLSDASMNMTNLNRANLEGANLTGTNLTYANLSYANLTNTNLTNINLTGANLTGANIQGLTLSGLTLSGANLSGLDLSNFNLSNANCASANLSGTNLQKANLSNANLTGADLSGADLACANLTNTNLTGADLTNATIVCANLTGATMVGAKLGGVNWVASTSASQTANATLTNVNLSYTDLTNASLTTLVMNGINLTGANLTGANLNSSSMENANLASANLTNVTATWANLSSANLSSAILVNANLSNATFVSASFRGANLTDANLSLAKGEHADFTSATLSNTNMKNADMDMAIFASINKTPSDSAYKTPQAAANLEGVNLDGTVLTRATWIDGSTCNSASVGRCHTDTPQAPSGGPASYATLTPALTGPQTGSGTLKTRYFVLFEGNKFLTVLTSPTLSATVSGGILLFGRTYQFYILDISTGDTVMGASGPHVFTISSKPTGVDDYGNPLIAQELKNGQSLADNKLSTLLAAGAGLSQQAILAAIQAGGGVMKDQSGNPFAVMNTNDVRIARSQGGQGNEVVMAASGKSVVSTVKPLTASGYSMDEGGNLKPDIAVNASGVSLPLGLFDFTVTLDASANSTEVIIIPPTPFASNTKWYKVVNGVVTEYPNFQVDASGNGILTLHDNDKWDANPAWGTIRDPGGPGIGSSGVIGVSGGGGSGCFIATAAFGSYFHPFVKILRTFRDAVLLTTSPGRSFVAWYYRVSPSIADAIRTSETMKAGVRIALLPLVGISYLSLTIGTVPTLLLLLLLAVGVVIGIQRLCRHRQIA